ncbi:hypothetical protein SpiGrapes_1221 [Sphaerochaeta pleomorpha str. Grapes]|uniref:Uncharacterized protein n=1 Tax=Sphaerochaeta pleomorpha (strain ATCC BAA-1885 / DSM 22778 / Grapes) TaxID=158190 RepID=G8QT71_SPHPG|nr:hypothetical protein [Sphaerochaeta pleomorpha]AEV29038.1 hypothetical protein SpiGrapes_1221 [Sphaerochaeta pleomorpha str. Grapes]
MRVQRKMVLTLIILYLSFSVLGARTLTVTDINVQGVVPVSESFTVVQNPDALNFNLAESRNTQLVVGTYTLLSNNNMALFHMYIKPGEDGMGDRFAFFLDNARGFNGGKKTVLPFLVRVTSSVSGAVSIAGDTSMDKEIGVRGIYAANDEITYETGEIIADIPNFSLDDYANGWYSASIQLSIEAH